MRRAMLSLFGAGFVPGAPGTLASGVAILVYLGMLWAFQARGAAVACALLALLFALVTVLAGDWAEREAGRRDPGWVVSDEVAGQLLAVMFTRWPAGVLVGFAGFRLLDIAKPFPIGRLQRLPGGWGILVDDLAAGLTVFALLRLLNWLAPVCGIEGSLVYPWR